MNEWKTGIYSQCISAFQSLGLVKSGMYYNICKLNYTKSLASAGNMLSSNLATVKSCLNLCNSLLGGLCNQVEKDLFPYIQRDYVFLKSIENCTNFKLSIANAEQIDNIKKGVCKNNYDLLFSTCNSLNN